MFNSALLRTTYGLEKGWAGEGWVLGEVRVYWRHPLPCRLSILEGAGASANSYTGPSCPCTASFFPCTLDSREPYPPHLLVCGSFQRPWSPQSRPLLPCLILGCPPLRSRAPLELSLCSSSYFLENPRNLISCALCFAYKKPFPVFISLISSCYLRRE